MRTRSRTHSCRKCPASCRMPRLPLDEAAIQSTWHSQNPASSGTHRARSGKEVRSSNEPPGRFASQYGVMTLRARSKTQSEHTQDISVLGSVVAPVAARRVPRTVTDAITPMALIPTWHSTSPGLAHDRPTANKKSNDEEQTHVEPGFWTAFLVASSDSRLATGRMPCDSEIPSCGIIGNTKRFSQRETNSRQDDRHKKERGQQNQD